MTTDFSNKIYRGHLRLIALLLSCLLAMGMTACGGEADTESELPVIDMEKSPVEGLDAMSVIGGGTVNSDFALLCELEGLRAVAGLRAEERMYPASLTKLMTFIVAYESAPDRTALIEITRELKNRYPEGSRIGIDVGDLMTVEQMLYALLLESDTDSALGLALHVAGSEEAFVALMNAKAEEMGLRNTHFANVTGLHAADHYSTAVEMAAILAYAVEIPLGREIMTTERYVTYLKYYKNGVLTDYRMTFKNTTLIGRFSENNVSNLLSDGTQILGGKTGFTDEADYCLATLAVTADGREYILITGHASSGENSARDAVKLYGAYAGE